MSKEKLQSDLLYAREETYKKDQIILWIFWAIREGHKYSDEIKNYCY